MLVLSFLMSVSMSQAISCGESPRDEPYPLEVSLECRRPGSKDHFMCKYLLRFVFRLAISLLAFLFFLAREDKGDIGKDW